MAKGIPMTDKVRDHALTLRNSGLTISQIAEIFNMGRSSIGEIFHIYDAISAGAPIAEYRKERQVQNIKWACERLGVSCDDVFAQGRTVAPPPTQEAPQETRDAADEANTALAVTSILEAIKSLTASVSSLENRLSTMQMTLAGSRDDANQNTKKIVEAININGDIQTKEWQDVKDRLEDIKINTKSLRKGGNF